MNKTYVYLTGVSSLILLIPQVKEFFIDNLVWRAVYLVALASSLSFFFTTYVIMLAKKMNAVDKPSERKVHVQVTPLWGGLAIYISFAVVTIYNFDFSLAQKGVAVGGTLLVGIGLLDDKFGVSAKLRILIQLVAAGIAIWAGARMTFLPNNWWGNSLEIILSVIWFVGITNAMNFLDGMDGLATGLTGINTFFFAAVAARTNQPFFLFLAAALGGACLGFLPYNFRKNKNALIFLGDTGSTFMGFMLAGIALTGDWASNNYVAVIVPVIILAIPIFDMCLTTFLRIKGGQVHSIGEWLHFTGRDHFHHRLADIGFGKRRTVQVIHLFAICLGINGFILTKSTLIDAGLLLVETAVLFAFLGYALVFVKTQFGGWAKLVSQAVEYANEITGKGKEKP